MHGIKPASPPWITAHRNPTPGTQPARCSCTGPGNVVRSDLAKSRFGPLGLPERHALVGYSAAWGCAAAASALGWKMQKILRTLPTLSH